MSKSRIHNQLKDLVQGKLEVSLEAIRTTLAARNADTKSSAGDKHEVGRAMAQQELDKLEEQRAKLVAQLQELDRTPLQRKYDRVAFGSLVHTDNGTYFITIGLGKLDVDGGTIYAISLASPIGQALIGRAVGEMIEFNGRKFTIRSIE